MAAKVGRLIAVGACALLCTPAAALASPESGSSPNTTLDLSPNDGNALPSPQTLTASGLGFPPGSVDLLQCTSDRVTCTFPLAFNVPVSGGSTFTAQINVQRVFVSDAGPSVDCGVVSCVVLAEHTTSLAYATHHLTFALPAVASPVLSSTSPPSPANENAPRIIGTAPAGSTVDLFTNSACSGSPVASGNAAVFADPGITVSVADNSTTTFYARATKVGFAPSACSSTSVTYVEDSNLAPPPGVGTPGVGTPGVGTPETKLDKAKISQKKRKATFKFSADEPGATFQCKLDKKPFKACGSPKSFRHLKPGKHRFQVAAVDAAGSVDPTPATKRFKIKR